jgi:hypothetical protein
MVRNMRGVLHNGAGIGFGGGSASGSAQSRSSLRAIEPGLDDRRHQEGTRFCALAESGPCAGGVSRSTNRSSGKSLQWARGDGGITAGSPAVRARDRGNTHADGAARILA